MKLRRIVASSIVATLLFTNPSIAATKAIKVLPAKPLFSLTLAGNPGDQISAATATPISLITVGTVDSSTLGGSDGFISATDFTGVRQWDLRLGGATDDIATAVLKDKTGGFWVAGTSAPILPPPSTNVDTLPVINSDSVSVETSVVPNNALTKLNIWKVTTTGQLASTFTFDLPGSAIVRNISADTAGYLISGEILISGKSSNFTISMNSTGVFTGLNTKAKAPAKVLAILTVAAGVNVFKSYLSSTAIKGIPTWKPKSAIPVIIKYTKKGVLLSASYLQGNVLAVLYQSGVGIIAITERSDYGVVILT